MFKIDKRYAKANNQKTIRFTDDLYMQLVYCIVDI